MTAVPDVFRRVREFKVTPVVVERIEADIPLLICHHVGMFQWRQTA